MQLPHLDTFTLSHLLSFLPHSSLAALTLASRAFGDQDAATRCTFLQRSIIHLPEPLLSPVPAARALSATLPSTTMQDVSGDGDSPEDTHASQAAVLQALVQRPGVTKLLFKCSETDAHWVHRLVQFVTPEVASKTTTVRIKQSVSSSTVVRPVQQRISVPNDVAQEDGGQATRPAVRALLLSRVRRSLQQTAAERASVARQWLAFAAAMPSLRKLDLGLIKVTGIEWLWSLPRLESLVLDAAELADETLLAPLGELSHLKVLFVQNYMAASAQAIAKMQQLESLWINESAMLHDLSALRQLRKLEVLTLTHLSAVSDLTFVQELCALRELKVSFVGQDQRIQLPELQSSSVSASIENQADGLSEPVETAAVLSLPHLKSVIFQRLRLGNLNFLALCPNLSSLSLQAQELTAIEMLTAVPELRDLKLSIDTVAGGKLNLSPLESLSKLTSLELLTLRGRLQSGSLPTLLNLKTLVVPAMDDFEPVCQRLTALSSLTVHDCSQVDVDYAPVLAELPMLTKLTLTFPIATGRTESAPARPLDLSPLQALTELRSLGLIHVTAENLGPLRSLTKLEELDLSAFYSTHLLEASIADFSPLTSLVNLRSLSVAGRSDFDESDLDVLRSCVRLAKLQKINTAELVIPTFRGVVW